jgi:predicted transcriptional regulator
LSLMLSLELFPAILCNLLYPTPAQRISTTHERSELAKQSGLGARIAELEKLAK